MPRLRSIALTLFLTLTLTSLGIIVLLVLLFRLSLGEGFSDYVARLELTRLDSAERYLLERYQRHGSWNFVRTPHDLLGPRPVPPQPLPGEAEAERGAPPPRPGPPPSDVLRLGSRLALFDPQQRLLMGSPSASPRPKRALRLEGGEVLGYLGLAPVEDAGEDPLTRQFMQSQTRNLALAGALAVLLSALAAAWLARHLRRPIAELAQAVGRLARGQLDARAVVDRHDELGALARDFNHMAQLLEQAEQSRRQFVADTSHELRTPLTILRAHTEAMHDGIMPLDQRGLARLRGTIAEMERLVDDLYLLARADEGRHDDHMEPIALADLLDDLAERFAAPMQQAGLRWQIEPAPPVTLRGDPARLRQLFGNLLGNALRYTDAGGEVRLSASVNAPMVDIVLDDSAPGVPDAALAHLFRRFYRVDASRSRAKGGAGLGLAICQSIVTSHGGRISAGHSPLGGLRVNVSLPLQTQARP